MGRRRIKDVLPIALLIPSVGPPISKTQYQREISLPSCRVRPSLPKTVDTILASEQQLITSGLQWLKRILIRPRKENIPQTTNESDKQTLHQFENLMHIDLQSYKDVVQSENQEGTSTSNLPSKAIEAEGCPSDNLASQPVSYHQQPFTKLSDYSELSVRQLSLITLQSLDNNEKTPFRTEATGMMTGTLNDAPQIDNFENVVVVGTCHFPYVPLRLFLDDWERRPNGTLHVGKLKQTIANLMTGDINFNTLPGALLSDLSIAISYLNLPQLILFRLAVSVQKYANGTVKSIAEKLDECICVTLINHIESNSLTPDLIARTISRSAKESSSPSNDQRKNSICSDDDNNNNQNRDASSTKALHLFEFAVNEQLNHSTADIRQQIISKELPRYKHNVCLAHDRNRKALIGQIPSISQIKRSNKSKSVTEMGKNNHEECPKDNNLRRLRQGLSQPLTPNGNCVNSIPAVASSEDRGRRPEERHSMGRQLLLIIGYINLYIKNQTRFFATSISWWYLCPNTTSSSDLYSPPRRLICQKENNNPPVPHRGIFVQFPSLITKKIRPLGQPIYALHLGTPPERGAVPQSTEIIRWIVLKLDGEGDLRLLEQPKWKNVAFELITLFQNRNRKNEVVFESKR